MPTKNMQKDGGDKKRVKRVKISMPPSRQHVRFFPKGDAPVLVPADVKKHTSLLIQGAGDTDCAVVALCNLVALRLSADVTPDGIALLKRVCGHDPETGVHPDEMPLRSRIDGKEAILDYVADQSRLRSQPLVVLTRIREEPEELHFAALTAGRCEGRILVVNGYNRKKDKYELVEMDVADLPEYLWLNMETRNADDGSLESPIAKFDSIELE